MTRAVTMCWAVALAGCAGAATTTPAAGGPAAGGAAGNGAPAGGGAARAADEPQTLALIVGCGAYAAAERLPALASATADARALAGWLQRPGATDVQVRLLLDAEATGARIRTELRDFLAAKGRMDDLVVIALAGYCAGDGAGGVAFLPHDADPDRAAETGITLAALTDAVKAISRADVLVLLDGGVGGDASGRWAGGTAPTPDAWRAALAALTARPRTAIVVAGEAGEGAGLQEVGVHGSFTYHWLEGARRAADPDQDGWVPLRAVVGGALEGVQTEALLAHRVQTPESVQSDPAAQFPVPKHYPGR